jgi:multiple sugar transport system permease protein
LVQSKKGLVAGYILLSGFALIMLLPFTGMIFTALKSSNEIYLTNSFSFFPKAWRVANFIEAMQVAPWHRYFFNSFIVTSIAVVGSLFFNSFAGYSFARLKFPGRDFLFFFILIGLMVPPQVTIIPQFLIMRGMPFFGGNNWLGQGGTGWLDTYYALIIPALSGSIGIFLCRQFYLGFPKALDEAARIDGCSPFRAYFMIYMPASRPIYASLGILKTVAVWNDFFYPLVMTNSEKMRTVQLGLQVYRSSGMVQWEYLMAATTIVTIPVLIIFLCFQRYFVQGIMTSGIK